MSGCKDGAILWTAMRECGGKKEEWRLFRRRNRVLIMKNKANPAKKKRRAPIPTITFVEEEGDIDDEGKGSKV
jgi:hypothetical protein